MMDLKNHTERLYSSLNEIRYEKFCVHKNRFYLT